jgi:hypothetical protein
LFQLGLWKRGDSTCIIYDVESVNLSRYKKSGVKIDANMPYNVNEIRGRSHFSTTTLHGQEFTLEVMT